MENIVQTVTNINNSVNGFVWGMPMLIMLVGTGILMTILTKAFQVSKFGHWMKNTIGGIWRLPSAPATSPAWRRPLPPVAPAPSSGCGSLPSSA